MRYFYIKKSDPFDYEKFGTSRLGVSFDNDGLEYSAEHFWNYSNPVKLILIAERGEKVLYFAKYRQSDTFISLMIPELKAIIETFNLPKHRWYEAKASYDREFVGDMHTYFGIDYDIDLAEERDYWILQILDREKEELAFDQMEWNIVEFRNRKNILGTLDKPIKSFQEYIEISKNTYLESESTNVIKTIEAPVYFYKKIYDILWGGIHIIFNEKVKAALESTGIVTPENGLEFAEFTEYKIEMLGDEA